MDLGDRIARRRSGRRGDGVFVDRNLVSPVVHPPEPVGRGPVLEQLLDALDPVFEGAVPADVAVVGPHGSGTSAIVTTLFDALTDQLGSDRRAIATTTRTGSELGPRFVAIDARETTSEFAFYHDLLSGLSTGVVPEGGVETELLRERLVSQLSEPGRFAVVAIDHHDEPGSLDYASVRRLLGPVADRVAVVAVGTQTPDDWEGSLVEVPAYRDHELIDVVTDRASTGLAAGVIEHDAIRELAEWADGNAHDALAALFGAAILAGSAGSPRIDAAQVANAMADVPEDGVHLARALAVSESRQRVLSALVGLDADERPIGELASEIAECTEFAPGTVTRFLYELADDGVLIRVPLPSTGSGRQPSTVRPQFPSIGFQELTIANSNSP